MPTWGLYALSLTISYLMGSYPTGVVVSRRKFGLDVRDMGSGNIGATNVTRVFGWSAGLYVFLIDFLKGVVPVWTLSYFFPEEVWLAPLAGLAVVLGHCFSVYLKFRGGKGVASSVGVLTVLMPMGALLAASTYLALLLFSRISSLGSLAGLVVTLTYMLVTRPPTPVAVAVSGMTLLVLIRHKSNIKRLVVGVLEKRAK